MTTSPTSTAAAYDQYADGLFTYCLSVLCEHDATVAAVREVRDLALRHGERLADPALRRAWLYSLARHCCLRRLAEGLVAPGPEHRRELASLAWPEAAGTPPEQREALELAVRHRLGPDEVAAVLELSRAAGDELLAAAEAEVWRTRVALLVLGVGSCPVLAELGGAGAESWREWVLGPALRRELVRHVVDCPTCRGTAERVSGELGRGLAALPGLPLLPAPEELRARMVSRRPAGPEEGALRFDQRGFPRHRAPSRFGGPAVRQRVVTTGVLAAVLTAPVVALWGAHRSDDGVTGSAALSSVRVETPAQPTSPAAQEPPTAPTVSEHGLELAGSVTTSAETLLPSVLGPAVPVPGHGATRLGNATPRLEAPSAPLPTGPGQLTVEAQEFGERTVITLVNSGGTTIHWHAEVDADWLRLSRDSGTLAPAQRITVTVTVDQSRAPDHQWRARIALPPSQAVVTLEGGPSDRGIPSQSPTPEASDSPSPTPGGSPSSTPTDPSGPGPSPTATPTPTGSPSPSSSASASTSATPTPQETP
ncbi:hypothetical protein OHV05_14370 [Kitasatospora sp. NBC_00070]|uniref:BACON domain-containing protein n=1 Tax=Kitasatospora sp. NBC_00070 TaxID=2975962 RepID=UPI003255CC9A